MSQTIQDPPSPSRRTLPGGMRLSGFMVIMLGLVVLAMMILVPSFGTYFSQQRQISELKAAVALGQQRVSQLEAERARWRDPAYIATQARERLYYVNPGEVVYLVQNDLDPKLLPKEGGEVSKDVGVTAQDWRSQMLGSLVEAGLAQSVSDPAPTPTPAPAQ